MKNSDALDKLVESWTINYPPEAVEEMLQQAGVGAGVVANAKDIDEDPQMNYYNFYREMDHPYMGKLRYYHPAPIKLSAVETAVGRPVLIRRAYRLYLHEDSRHVPERSRQAKAKGRIPVAKSAC